VRKSLAMILQEQIADHEKKNETRHCPKCQTKTRHRGDKTKEIVTSTGMIKLTRQYTECLPCRSLGHVADVRLGLDGRYTVGLRRLAVKVGTMCSFDKAAENLEEFCGIKLSDNTIRDLCQKEAVPMGRWQRTNPVAHEEFTAAEGDVEFTTDGTCVNTKDGWREMRVGIFAKRERGEGVHPDQWDDRKLPKPHVSVAFAGIENKEQFRKHWDGWAKRLGVDDDMISVLGDGAHWIWDAAMLEFAKRDEVFRWRLQALRIRSNFANIGTVGQNDWALMMI